MMEQTHTEQSDSFPETTFNSETCEIKGSDGRWYKVPEPVLIRFMTVTGFAGVNMAEMKRIIEGTRSRVKARARS